MSVPFLLNRRVFIRFFIAVGGAAGLHISGLQATESLVTDFDDPLRRLDGWTVFTAEGVTNDIGNPRWEAEGGNPDGFFAVEDLARGGVIYYSAPPKFLGDRSAAYGLILSYDVSSTTTNTSFDGDDVVLEGENLRLIYRHDPIPEPDGWTLFSLALEEGNRWRVTDTSETWEGNGWEIGGDVPSASQFVEVLGGLQGLYIRGEYWSGSTSLGLDNVDMEVAAGSINAPAEVVDAHWLGGDGDWTDPDNWSTDSYPRNDVPEQGYRYRAIIDAAGDYTVTMQGDLFIEELEIDSAGATLNLGSSLVHAREGFQLLNGRVELAGGLLYATDVSGHPDAVLAITGDSRFVDISLADIELFLGSGNDLLVSGDLVLDGATVRLDRTSGFVDTRLRFDDGATQTLAGNGEVIFDGSNSSNLQRQRVEAINENGHLVLDPGITIRTGMQGGQVGNSDNPVTNYGTIRAETDGRFINFFGTEAINEGTLEARDGGQLRVDNVFSNNAVMSGDGGSLQFRGDWVNNGTLTTVDTLVDFGSDFTLQDVGTFVREGGIVRITGTLENTGSTLLLNESFGTWDLHGGTVIGGTVAAVGDSRLRATSDARLEEVVLQSVELFIGSGNNVLVTGDLTLDDATVRFDRTSGFVDTRLRFDQGATQTLAGNGEVVFDGSNSSNLHRQRLDAVGEGGHLVLAEGITVRTGTQAGQVGNATHPLTNYGRLLAETPARSLLVAGSDFINEGIVEVRNGGRVEVSGLAGDLNTLIMAESGGRADLEGDYTINQEVTVPQGAHLTLSGVWTNAATITLNEGRLDLGDSYSTADLGTITRTQGEIRLGGILNNSDTIFDLTAIAGDAGEVTLAGGTIVGGTLSGQNEVMISVIGNSRLEDVTLSSLELFIAGGNDVLVSGDLTLDVAVIRFDRTSSFTDTRVRFDDGALQTLAGVGEVIFDGTNSGNLHRQRVEAINEGAHLVLAEGITVRTGTQAGQLGNASFPFTNYGRLVAETANRTLIVVGSDFINEGSLEAVDGGHLDVQGLSGQTNTLLVEDEDSRITLAGDYLINEDVTVSPGATLSLTGQWSNLATIFLHEGRLDWEGDFDTADLGFVESTDGDIRLIGNLDNTGSHFDLSAYAGNGGAVHLHGGTISGGTVFGAGSAELRVSNDGRLDQGIVLSAMELFLFSGNDVLVSGDLILDNATLRFDRTSSFTDTRVRFDDGALQTLAGAGEVIFDGTNSGNLHRQRVEAINEGAHLVLAEGITVRTGTQAGQLGNASYPFTNYGRLVAETANRTLIVAGNDFVNEGILEIRNGSTIDIRGLSGDLNSLVFTGDGGRAILEGDYAINEDVLVPGGARLTLRGDWTNLATVTADGGTIDLEGNWFNQGVLAINDTLIDLSGEFTLAQLGTLNRTGGTVRVLGTLDNQGGTLALDETTGSWELHGGAIIGGEVTGSGTESILVTNDGRLDNVTLSRMELFIASGNDVLVSGDLTLDDAVIRFDRTSSFTDTRVRFDDGAQQTLAGAGEVVFDGTNSGNLHRQRVEAINEGAHLVLAAGITVRTGTQAGQVGNTSYPFTNHGRLLAETPGRTFIVAGSDFINEGILESVDGGQLDVRGLTGNAGTLLLEGESSHLIVDGDYTLSETVNVLPGARLTLRGQWENAIAVTVDAGTFDLEGDWSNTGTILATESLVQLDGAFTLNHLGNFSRSGGTVRITGILDNSATVLSLDETFGSWDLHGGTINGGEVAGSEGAVLGITNDGRLNNVTLTGIELFLASGNDALVSGDLTLDDAVIRFDRTSSFTDTRVRFDDGAQQTLAGAGEVVFDGTNSGNLHRQRVEAINEGAHLVLAEDITVRTGTQAGQIGNSGTPLTNRGRLVAQTSGRTLIVAASDFINEGILEAREGGTLQAPDLGADAGQLLAGVGGRIITEGNLADFESVTFEIGSLSGENFGRIEVSGTATLGGSAEVILTGDEPLALGDDFTVLEATSIDGVFAEVSIPEESGAPVLEISYGAETVVLAVPERAPLQPLNPIPADGMGDVVINPTLSWSDGGLSESYRIHLGVNPDPLAEPELGTQAEATFAPDTLEWGTTYYWQVVALNQFGETAGPVWSFTTRGEPDLGAGTYWVASDGNWTNGANWTSAPHHPDNESPDPGDRYTVIIDATGEYVVTLDGDVTIDRLIIDAPGATLRHTGGTLTVLDKVEVLAGTYELAGGTLAEGRLTSGGEGSVNLSANSRFQNVTLDPSADLLIPNSRILSVTGNLTLDNAMVRMHSSGSITRIRFDEGVEQQLAGTGEIVFDGTSGSDNRHRVESWGTGTHLFITQGITIRSGEMGGQVGVSRDITNHGAIVSETAGRTVQVTSSENFANQGALLGRNGGILQVDSLVGEAGNVVLEDEGTHVSLAGDFVVDQNIEAPTGTRLSLTGVANLAQIDVTNARLDLAGEWTNNGTISSLNSLLDLGGTFTLADLDVFERFGGTVRLTGTLENESGTLLLDAESGSWDLHGGRVRGGTVAFADGESLNLTANSTLEDVTLDSSVELLIPNAQILYVVGDLTLDDAVVRMHSTGSITRIRFEDGAEQHLAGTGEIIFDGTSNSNNRHRVEPWSTGTHLFIGEGITVRSGEMGGLVGGSRDLTNHGAIISTAPGRTVQITSNETFVNTGNLRASGGGILAVDPLSGNTGHFRADAPGRIEISGDAVIGTGFRTEIGGLSASEYGRLVVSGTATLEGTLEVTFTDAFAPQMGDVFDIIAAGSIEGEFASVEAPEEIGDGFIEVIYREDGVAILISGAPPLQARDPFPADGAENVARHPILNWSDGGLTSSFEVYFGTNPDPAAGEFQGTITGTGFDPGPLDYATTYYWRIDAENEVDLTPGEVWTFTTRPEPAAIAGTVWRDDNGDGVVDPEETPIEDRWVYLDLNDNGIRNSGEPRVRTEADGSFLFDDLAPGEYAVRQILPNGWEQTFPEGGVAHLVTVEAGEQRTGVDFGSRRSAPAVVASSTNPSSPIPATEELVVTVRFDRSMDAGSEPVVTFTPQAGAAAPEVSAGGTWSRTSHTNDTYRTPPINVVAGMDGEHTIQVAEATDLHGLVMEAAEVLVVTVNATPPETVTLTVTDINESTVTIDWSDYEAPGDLNLFRIYREDGSFASLHGLAAYDGAGGAAREYTFNGLDLDREYHVAVGAVDTALNMDREVASIPLIIESDLPPPLTPELSSPRLTAALLEWTDYDTSGLFGFAGYRIYVEETDFSSVEGLAPYAETGPEAEGFEVAGLDRTRDYYLAVVPFNRLDEYVSDVTTVQWRDPLAEALTADMSIGGEGETFEVFHPLLVDAGATLTLRAGTTLTFAQGAGIEIENGRLVSEGTPEQPVHLTAAVESGRGAWDGVILGPGANGSEIFHTWIRHGGGLLIDGSQDHVLEGLRVVWNLPAGIELMNGAEAIINESLVALNQDDGLWVGAGSALTLRGSVIKNNAREATVESGASLDARENWWGRDDLTEVSMEIEGDADLNDLLTEEPILGVAITPLNGLVTGERNIVLRLISPNATSFRASEDSTFSGIFFEDIPADPAGADLYRSTPLEVPFTLSDGAGEKTVFIEFRAADGSIADARSLVIEYVTDGPVITAFSLEEGDEFSRPVEVTGSAEAEQEIAALEFYVENELVLASTNGELQGVWDFRGREASIVRVRLEARDALGLIATRELNVRLSPEPPPAPAIGSPVDGSLFSEPQVTVSGTAEPGIDVHVVRNGILLGTVTADQDGAFVLENANLSEGSNILVARATDAVGSTSSPPVTVNLDTVPPVPLIVESAEYLTNRGIQVFMRFPTTGKRAETFRVLWSEDPMLSAGDADGQSDPITTTDYLIEGLPDGEYYIAVVGFDGAGNSSGLSNVMTAVYDDTPPAFTVAFDQVMPMGPGDLGITLSASEALRSTPTLTVRPANFSTPISVSLTEAGGNTYTGTYVVSPLSGSTGTAEVRVSGRDLAGNSFAGAPSGPDLVFDVSRPVASIAVDQPEPVQVFDGVTEVGVTLTVNKPVPGAPSLTFSPPVGAGVEISLSGNDEVWTGSLTLTEAMGTGVGTFVFSVTDALGNAGTAIESGGELEIYNTETAPPPPVPTGLEAVTRTAGEIGIQWNPAEGAEIYHLYRAEGGTGPHPTERIASALTDTVFFDTPPGDGFYRYAVSSERLGSESNLSGMVSAESDRTPPEVPENVTAELDLNGTVRISWEAPSSGEAPAGYRVYRNDGHVSSRANPGIVTDAPPRGLIEYRVASVDSVGNENRSDPVTVELFVGAVSTLVATVTEGGAPALSWIGEDDEAVGYHVYAGGERVNEGGPLSQSAYTATEPVIDEAVEFRVRAVDDEGRESAARTVTVYPVTADLGFNLDSAGNDRTLMTRYFDLYEITATHSAASDWLFQEVAVTRFEGGNETEISLPLDEETGLVEAGGAGTWEIAFPGVIDILEDYTFRVELRQVEDDDSVALYRGHFNGPVAVDSSIMIAVTTAEPPLAGGENDFRARIYNQGYADMDVLLVRSGGSEPGDLILEVLDLNGTVVHAVPFDRPVSGMNFTGDGRGYLRIPPGESKSVVFENVLVPESLAEEGSARIRVRAPSIYQAMGTARERTSGPLSGSMTTNLVESPYFGTLETDAPGYADNQPITLTGQAIDRETGLPVPNAELSIGFFVRGFHWFREVTTDENGNFTYEYTPPPGLSGSIGFWAAHPDVVDVLDQAEVAVLRLMSSPSRGEIRMSKNDTLDFNLQLINPGDLPMTLEGVSARFYIVDEEDEEIEIDTVTLEEAQTLPSNLEPDSRNRAHLRLRSELDAPDLVMAEIFFETEEGATALFRAEITLLQAIPILRVAEPSRGYVDRSLDRGDQRSRRVTIANAGLRALEGVEIVPPQNVGWMYLNLPADEDGIIRVPDLEVGDELEFQVVYAPPGDTELGFYDDVLVIRGDNAVADFEMGLFSEITSNLTGDAQFVVTNIIDQQVPNASVRLRNTVNRIERGPYYTDAEGELLVEDLQEGHWSWQVTAPGHSAATGTVDIEPDQIELVEPELNRSLVTVTFDVVPVPYTDRYEIRIEQTFETRVPAPVMLFTPPVFEFENVDFGFETTVMAELRNEGLISVNDVEIEGGQSDLMSLTPLIEYIPELRPEQVVEIPVRVRIHEEARHDNGAGPQATPLVFNPHPSPCGAVSGEDFAAGIGAIMDLAAEGDFGSASLTSLKKSLAAMFIGVTVYQSVTQVGSGGLETVIGFVGGFIECAGHFMSGSTRNGGTPSRGGGSPGPRPAFEGGGRGCFLPDTPVTLADGTSRSISELRSGDVLRAGQDPRSVATLSHLFRLDSDDVRTLRLRCLDGTREDRELHVTGEHRLWQDGRGWTHVRNLSEGDWLSAEGGGHWEIVSMERLEGEHTVYTFQLTGDHAFYADGVLAEDVCGGAFLDLSHVEVVSQ